jgi:hypothetical protein
MKYLGSAGALKLATAVVIVCAALSGGGRAASAKGLRYAPAGGGFSVVFPAAPEKHSDKHNFGALVFHIKTYRLIHGEMNYMVMSFGDMPAEVLNDPLLEEYFFSRMEEGVTRGGQSAGMPVSVVSRTNISLDGFRGRQLVIDMSPMMGVIRGYKAGRRFYAVGVIGDKSDFSAQHAVAFLDSFKITEK